MKRLLAKLVLLATTVTAFAITYDEWRAEHFTPAEFADSAISGETADPDFDGNNNFLEFAFDTDPKNFQSGTAPQVTRDPNGKLTMIFPRWSARPGLLYAPLVTGGLDYGW